MRTPALSRGIFNILPRGTLRAVLSKPFDNGYKIFNLISEVTGVIPRDINIEPEEEEAVSWLYHGCSLDSV